MQQGFPIESSLNISFPVMFVAMEGVCDTRLHVILNVYYKKWGIRTEVPTPRVPDLMIDVRNDE